MEGLSAGCFQLEICRWCSVQRSSACCFFFLLSACLISVNAAACEHGAFTHCSATTFNPLTIKINNTRHLPAVQYCAGKLRLLTFMWIHLTQTICPKHPCRSSTPTVALALLAGLGGPAGPKTATTQGAGFPPEQHTVDIIHFIRGFNTEADHLRKQCWPVSH